MCKYFVRKNLSVPKLFRVLEVHERSSSERNRGQNIFFFTIKFPMNA